MLLQPNMFWTNMSSCICTLNESKLCHKKEDTSNSRQFCILYSLWAVFNNGSYVNKFTTVQVPYFLCSLEFSVGKLGNWCHQLGIKNKWTRLLAFHKLQANKITVGDFCQSRILVIVRYFVVPIVISLV